MGFDKNVVESLRKAVGVIIKRELDAFKSEINSSLLESERRCADRAQTCSDKSHANDLSHEGIRSDIREIELKGKFGYQINQKAIDYGKAILLAIIAAAAGYFFKK